MTDSQKTPHSCVRVALGVDFVFCFFDLLHLRQRHDAWRTPLDRVLLALKESVLSWLLLCPFSRSSASRIMDRGLYLVFLPASKSVCISRDGTKSQKIYHYRA